METINTASRQWATRPDDERFVSLTAMQEFLDHSREFSAARALSNRALTVQPVAEDSKGLAVIGPNGSPVLPTHWAFGQLAQRAGAPVGYLRDLPAPLAADCMNYGLRSRPIVGSKRSRPRSSDTRHRPRSQSRRPLATRVRPALTTFRRSSISGSHRTSRAPSRWRISPMKGARSKRCGTRRLASRAMLAGSRTRTNG